MDHRILIAAVVGLVLVAFGGFYFALSPKSSDVAVLPAKPPPLAQSEAPPKQGGQPPPAQAAATPAPAPARGQATAATIDAELARSDLADLQALLKNNFAAEYQNAIEDAARHRNEGASSEQTAAELSAAFQEMMRPKLKFAVSASVPVIDKMAANEIDLFHTLGTDGASFCLAVLGKNPSQANAPMPDNITRMMRLGTLYRFQAIAEGTPQYKALDPLRPDEMGAFETGLKTNNMRIEDVRSGAFLNEDGGGPGKPCLMIEKLYRTIAGLDPETRRKLYAGMFFLGRDK